MGKKIKHVFFNGHDWVIAEDQHEAKNVHDSLVGYECDDEWKQEPDDDEITVFFDDSTKPKRLPEGAEVETFDPEEETFNIHIKATARAWADWSDADNFFLASTEW